MRRLLLTTAFILSGLLLFPAYVSADNNYQVSADANYNIDSDGNTKVIHSISIKNTSKFKYVSSFRIRFLKIEDIRSIKAFTETTELPVQVKKDDNATIIQVDFKDRIAGIDKVNKFNFSFESISIAKKIGSTWEVSIPGLSDPEEFNEFNAYINVPDEFGAPTISKPKKNLQPKGPYIFSKSDIGKSGVYLVFGNKQVFNFKIIYNLSNSNLFPIQSEITLPSSNNYQDVIIKNISPAPNNVYKDVDGNWLAVFSLTPNKKVDIFVEGSALFHAIPEKIDLTEEQKKLFLSEKKYWNTENKELRDLASKLITPENIYQYVIDKLSYDYNKISTKTIRIGAVDVMQKPDSSVCLEYTDLFVTLARAAGIPARAVEGYAYTRDNKLRPLSQIKDILHVWPEYYDYKRRMWVMVDPTWGDTTNNMDYFNSLDLNHLSFIVKGRDSIYPIPPGGYKRNPDSKNIQVWFGDDSDFSAVEKHKVVDKSQDYYLPILPVTARFKVINAGNSEIKNKNLLIISNDLSPDKINIIIDSIPPFGNKEYEVSFSPVPLFNNGNHSLKIQLGDKMYSKSIKSGFVYNSSVLLGGVVFVGLFSILIFALKTRRLPIPK